MQQYTTTSSAADSTIVHSHAASSSSSSAAAEAASSSATAINSKGLPIVSSLFAAVQLGDEEQVFKHLYRIEEESSSESSCICCCCTLCHALTVRELSTDDSSSALHWAVWIRSPTIFQAIIQSAKQHRHHPLKPLSAAVSGTSASSSVSSSSAPFCDDGSLLYRILNHRNTRQESILEWAIRGGDMTILSYLLQSPLVDLSVSNCRNAFGGTPAHIAAEEGHEQILTALYLRGLPVDIADSRGKTPLQCAAHRGRPAAAECLIRLGANPFHRDNEGGTSLHYAAISGHEGICRDLLKKGMVKQLLQPAFTDQLNVIELAEKYQQGVCASFLKMWKKKAFSFGNRWFVRMGLDPPPTKRPFLTSTQIYFFIGIIFTLFHFQWYIYPVISLPEWKDRIGWLFFGSLDMQLTILWVGAILAMIGMGGFMFLDPGLVTRKSMIVQSNSAELASIATTTHDKNSAVIPDYISTLLYHLFLGTPVCASCEIIKPLRSKHCAPCGGCILRMDHHCPWVNRCVGSENHRSFICIIIAMLFAALAHANCVWHFLFSVKHVEYEGAAFSPSHFSLLFTSFRLPLFLFVHSCLIVLGCSGLLFGQTFVIIQGLTTNESFNRYKYAYLRHGYQTTSTTGGTGTGSSSGGNSNVVRFVSPFTEGWLGNCLSFWGINCFRKSIGSGKSFLRRSQVMNNKFQFTMNNQNNNDNDKDKGSNYMNGRRQKLSNGAHCNSHCGAHSDAASSSSSSSAASSSVSSSVSSSISHSTIDVDRLHSSYPTASLHAELSPPVSASSSSSEPEEVEPDCAYIPSFHQEKQELLMKQYRENQQHTQTKSPTTISMELTTTHHHHHHHHRHHDDENQNEQNAVIPEENDDSSSGSSIGLISGKNKAS